MKTGKTLMELAAELDRQNSAKRDFVCSAPALSYEAGHNAIKIAGQGWFEVADSAHDQIATHLGVPAKYYSRMKVEAPELLATNVNHWLQKSTDRRMVRTLDGKVRAFLSDKYRPLDNVDLMEAILPTLNNQGFRVESCEVTDKRMYLKCVTERLSFEPKKGDVVQAGLVVSNSEIGFGKLAVDPLLYRLVCTNGMIAASSALRKYHVGRSNDVGVDGASEFFRDETRIADDRAFWFKVRDTVAGIMTQVNFKEIATRFFAAQEEKIEADPVVVLEKAATRFEWNQGERNGVLTHLLSGGDLSKFGLVNAITRHAQDVPDYDRATQFERLGGEVLELPRSDWNAIAGAV